MKCFRCDASMATGATMFRVNEKGVPGIWACLAHRVGKIDPEVDAIVSVIASAMVPPDIKNGLRMAGEGEAA